ncbi:hypothetical protein CALVIDRAFT_555303 [Calocera viscosa TUFC12733]|uniref:Mediator of RNA polymerase II transcription subunit 5 n=1 Tax=Calocera viscosa (strain TUFC12733) TaxID=1330018 RepID=A0A167M174_CALVF|nr:hypothetical protein CALVIDRAFT_555303 [Calocera viscosa TUFC12733]
MSNRLPILQELAFRLRMVHGVDVSGCHPAPACLGEGAQGGGGGADELAGEHPACDGAGRWYWEMWAKLVRTATGGAPYHGALYGPEICETLLDLLSLYTSSPSLLAYLALSLGLPALTASDLSQTYARVTDSPLIPLYVYVRTLIDTLGQFPARIPISLAEPLCKLALLANQAFSSPMLGPLPAVPNPLLAPAASPLPLIQPFVILLTSLSAQPGPGPAPTAAPELLLHTLSLLQADHQIPALSQSEKSQILQAVEASSVFAQRFSIAHKGLVRVQQLIRMQEAGEGGLWGGMGVGVGDVMGAMVFAGAAGAGQVQTPGAERDKLAPSLPLMSLLLSSMVEHRATPFGAGSQTASLSLLQLLQPDPSSALAEQPQSSYSSLLQASISLISLHPYPTPTTSSAGGSGPSADDPPTHASAVLWRGFILGRLPSLLSSLPLTPEGKEALEQALEGVFKDWRRELDSCNPPSGPGQGFGSSDSVDEESKPPSFRIDLLRSLVSAELLSEEAATRLCPSFSKQDSPLSIEAAENMCTPEEYIEDRLSGASAEDALAFLTRMEGDWRAHKLLAQWFLDRFSGRGGEVELDQLSAACRLLYSHPLALELFSLWNPVHALVHTASEFLASFDFDAVNDPQSALGLYGEVVLFCQFALMKYKLTFPDDPDAPDPPWAALLTTSRPHPLRDLSSEEKSLLARWLKALFSPNEGIDDPMLRATDPAMLLRLTTTFFDQAILARSLDVIDSETLHNGVGYFLSGLLSWTLVGIVQYLAAEAERQGPYSSLHFEILQMILVSESCPKPVLAVTGASVLRLLTNTRLVNAMQAGGVNVQGMRDVVNKALCTTEDPFTDHNYRHTLPAWSDNCQSAVREAFTQAQMNKVTTLEVDRYLDILRPREFVDILWDACLSGASMGAMDGCRIVTAFLLSGLRSPTSPPLLPYFLLVFVPSLLSDLDRQSPQQSNATMDTLVTIIVSACHLSFQLERSFLKIADGAPLSIELRSRLQPRIWLNALLDRLELSLGSASRLLSKRLHVVLND